MEQRKSALESMVVDKAFWDGKKVFLTGHTGFKGGWLSLWLRSLGANVTGFALEPSAEPNLFNVANVSQDITSIIGDIRNLSSVESAVREHSPDIIIHMAAQPLVRYSYTNPVETYETNVIGTVNMLEAARKTRGVRAFINVTSDKCYENREWIWGYRENEPMGGHDPYSSSKGCAELVTSAYRDSFFNSDERPGHSLALASARAGNVIGGGDWAEDRLVPDLMRAIMDNKVVTIRNPGAIRPWQHVLEPLSGYLLLAQKLWEHGNEHAEGWNFGPKEEDAKPVSWIADYISSNWGDNVEWDVKGCDKEPHEAQYLKLDCAKAMNRLGWHPKWDLEKALDSVIEWYKAYWKEADMHELTLAQIESYSG